MTITNRFQRIGAIGAAAVLVFSLAACSSGQEEASASSTDSSAAAPAGADEVLKITYIQKQGDQQYFVDEAEGAKAQAEELGNVEVTMVDVGTDSNAAITAVNTAVAQGADGVAIVVPDAKIGPQVGQILDKAGIPYVASDDPFELADGTAAPWVSIDSLTMGQQVGEKAGELYVAAGWSADDTRIISVLQEDLGVCQDRETGQLEKFTEIAGETPDVVRVGTDNSTPTALSKTGAAITANQGVKHWVVIGCNDEGVTGSVKALENSGVSADDVIGVGLGAYLACKDWKAGVDSGNKAALYIDGRVDGAASVKVLVDHLRTGDPIPAETLGKAVMVDADTWEDSGMLCG
ncbi:substrate-binding domain-containing protein [Demequina aurantiaca]|uniref:substrate-binding domain-containing protein n=1 Tax=Demequina aurantiaca TaxID=676200 RepID=UPI0009FF6A00|nr:substrate-binding domain-containing protein [Demequina aurantiaca]